MVKLIEQYQGVFKDSVSTRTSYLISCGEMVEAFGQLKKVTETSKYKKALAIKVPIMTDFEFENHIKKIANV